MIRPEVVGVVFRGETLLRARRKVQAYGVNYPIFSGLLSLVTGGRRPLLGEFPRPFIPQLSRAQHEMISNVLMLPVAAAASLLLYVAWLDNRLVYDVGADLAPTALGSTKEARREFNTGETVSFKVRRFCNFTGNLKVTQLLMRVRPVDGVIGFEIVERVNYETNSDPGIFTFFPKPFQLPKDLPPGQYMLKTVWAFSPYLFEHSSVRKTQLFQVNTAPAGNGVTPTAL